MVSQAEKDEIQQLEVKQQNGTISDSERQRLNELKNK
jgi:hypothetical protein